MEEVFQIIFEFIAVAILQYPGAFIRWILSGKKRKFEDLLKEDSWTNAGVSIAVFLLFFAIISVLVYYL